MSDFNSKYSGEEIEALLDKVKSSNLSNPYYIIESVTIDDLYSMAGSIGPLQASFQEWMFVTQCFQNKIPVYIRKLTEDSEICSMIPVTGYREDLFYLTIIEYPSVFGVEVSINEPKEECGIQVTRYELLPAS